MSDPNNTLPESWLPEGDQQNYTKEEIFQRLRDLGVIKEDVAPALCMGCQQELTKIKVSVRWNDTNEAITSDTFDWFPGIARFVVAPNFFKWCQLDPVFGEVMAHFEAECAACGAYIPELEIIEDHFNPAISGLKFGAASKMAGSL